MDDDTIRDAGRLLRTIRSERNALYAAGSGLADAVEALLAAPPSRALDAERAVSAALEDWRQAAILVAG